VHSKLFPILTRINEKGVLFSFKSQGLDQLFISQCFILLACPTQFFGIACFHFSTFVLNCLGWRNSGHVILARFQKIPDLDLWHMILKYFSKKHVLLKKFWVIFFDKSTIFIIGTFHISHEKTVTPFKNVSKNIWNASLFPIVKLHNQYCHNCLPT
jgi:hypothetical protein